MNRIVISENGFPATNYTWRFLQDSLISAVDAITKILGEKVILFGLEIEGGSITAGAIIFNNEIFEFQTGTLAATVTIIEEVENRAYKVDYNDDNLFENLPAYKRRYAKCGTGGVSTFNFSELVRLTKLQDIFDGNYNSLQNLPDLSKLNWLNQFVSMNNIGHILVSGEISIAGARLNYRGNPLVGGYPFSCSKIGTGRYKIIHNLGHSYYGLVGAGIDSGVIKVGIDVKSNNECTVIASDDSSPNDARFSFILYKTTNNY